MNYNYLGGLHRELHYVKKIGGEEGYEPALFVFNHHKKGRSFVVPLSAMWKYVDPIDYGDDPLTSEADKSDFQVLVNKNYAVATGRSGTLFVSPTLRDAREAVDNLAACQFAEAFYRNTKIMLCTSYNLAKCMQLFEIPPVFQAAAQLLMWIQSRLDDLKNMPENPEKDEVFVEGEVKMFVGGDEVATREMTVTDTELVERLDA